MSRKRKSAAIKRSVDSTGRRAVANYRRSVHRPEHSIRRQRNQVRKWAEKNGIEIIQEFIDSNKSDPKA